MTPEQMESVKWIARQGDWHKSGDIGGCDVKGCLEEAAKFAEVRKEYKGDTWYFCAEHFAQYLRATDELRSEKYYEA